MKKNIILISANIVLATTLGIYGQSISYYINRHVEAVSPLFCLTLLTMISICLFLTNLILILRTNRIEEMKINKITLEQMVNSFIGIPVSLFSLFVLIMWWS